MPSRIYTTGRLGAPNKLDTYDSQGTLNSDVIATAPCVFLKAHLLNKASSGILYVQFFDAASVPNNGAVPMFVPIALSGPSFATLDMTVIGEGLNGLLTSAGLCWAASSTPATLTIDNTSSVWVTARFYQ